MSPILSIHHPARQPANRILANHTIKTECLFQLILFGEASLRRATTQFLEHYHLERNHQGKANLLLFPAPGEHRASDLATIRCRERLGGLLNTTAAQLEYFDHTGSVYGNAVSQA